MKLLKFSLPTCKPCIVLSKQMEDLDLSNYEVQEINLHENDETKALGEKYGIKSVPTIVAVDEEGNEIKRIRNIVQLKDFLKEPPFLIFEAPVGAPDFVKFVVGIDEYQEESAKVTILDRIKNIFK